MKSSKNLFCNLVCIFSSCDQRLIPLSKSVLALHCPSAVTLSNGTVSEVTSTTLEDSETLLLAFVIIMAFLSSFVTLVTLLTPLILDNEADVVLLESLNSVRNVAVITPTNSQGNSLDWQV